MSKVIWPADLVRDSIDIGWFYFAFAYFEAAVTLQATKRKALHADAPVCFLYYHAIEIALKAYLIFKGATVQEVEEFRHRISKLGKACSEKGLRARKLDRDVFELIDLDGNAFAARYLRAGILNRPTEKRLHNSARHILRELHAALKNAGRPVIPSTKIALA